MITWTDVTAWLLLHGIRILIVLALSVLLWFFISKTLPLLVRRTVAKSRGESQRGLEKRAQTLVQVLTGAGQILLIVIVILVILSEVGIPVGPILAGLGVVGIAVGFGAQYLIRDIIAGIFILWENQYRVGDMARIADVEGMVEYITLRKTVLRDVDGVVHHIPNGEIKVASNFSRHFSRVNFSIPVAYHTDLDHAISVINRIGSELAREENWKDKFITAPAVLRVNNFSDSGIDIKILCDVKPLEQWAIMGELRLRLKKAFDAESIEIPWPHMKVYFGNEPPKNDKNR
jgi:small-conductance mechanosensitive channel